MIVRDSYIAGLRKVASRALQREGITAEQRRFWDGYRQALDDVIADGKEPQIESDDTGASASERYLADLAAQEAAFDAAWPETTPEQRAAIQKAAQ